MKKDLIYWSDNPQFGQKSSQICVWMLCFVRMVFWKSGFLKRTFYLFICRSFNNEGSNLKCLESGFLIDQEKFISLMALKTYKSIKRSLQEVVLYVYMFYNFHIIILGIFKRKSYFQILTQFLLSLLSQMDLATLSNLIQIYTIQSIFQYMLDWTFSKSISQIESFSPSPVLCFPSLPFIVGVYVPSL